MIWFFLSLSVGRASDRQNSVLGNLALMKRWLINSTLVIVVKWSRISFFDAVHDVDCEPASAEGLDGAGTLERRHEAQADCTQRFHSGTNQPSE